VAKAHRLALAPLLLSQSNRLISAFLTALLELISVFLTVPHFSRSVTVRFDLASTVLNPVAYLSGAAGRNVRNLVVAAGVTERVRFWTQVWMLVPNALSSSKVSNATIILVQLIVSLVTFLNGPLARSRAEADCPFAHA
jgi:hypothetical protein